MPSFWKQIAVSQIDDEHGNDKTAENVDYSGWSFNGLVFNHIKLSDIRWWWWLTFHGVPLLLLMRNN